MSINNKIVTELEDFMFTGMFTGAFQEVKEVKKRPPVTLSKWEVIKIVAHSLCISLLIGCVVWGWFTIL